ncbi:MAG: helix-turn-helix domain-containing protein [Planctomycetes bacterium]|nr:helix-turn-helix domain-containing protein [Planctomycetota bacterium]
MNRSLFGILGYPQAQKLSAIDKLVLVYLMWRQGENRVSWPSLRTIARDLHIERRTCLRSIARLCRAECIEKTSGRCGRGHSNRYVVLFSEKGSACPLLPSKKRSQPDPSKGVILTPQKESGRPLNYNRSNQGTIISAPSREDFDRVWSVYPKQIGRSDALLLWQKLSPGPELVEQIIDSIRSHAASEQWTRSLAEDGGRFIPRLTKFLERRQWEDQPPAKPEPKPGDPDWLPDEDEADRLLGFSGDPGGGV